MPNYLKLFEPIGKAAEKGLAKVGIKITGEKVTTTGTKALAKMAEDGRGTFTKLTEKLAKERGVSSARFGEDAVAKQTRKMADEMARKAAPHVRNYASNAAAKVSRQALRPVVSTAERASSYAARRSVGAINRAASQASHSMLGSIGSRYEHHIERILANMNPVQRFFYNVQVQLSNMLSRFFGINTGFMNRFADRMGRVAFADARLATKTGEGLATAGVRDSFKNTFESNLSKLMNITGRSGRALSNIAKQSVGKSYERLTGEELFASASKAGEKAIEETTGKVGKKEAENLVKEGTEQIVSQEAKKATEEIVEHTAESVTAHTAEQTVVHTGEKVVADEGKKVADTVVHEWKNVAKGDLKVGDHVRLVDKSGKALDGSEVIIKGIKDGKFTVESVKKAGLIPNQNFEKQAIQRLENTTAHEAVEQVAKQGLHDGAETSAKEGLGAVAKETTEKAESKTHGLLDLSEDFQKKMNQTELFQWKRNKLVNEGFEKQKEGIQKLYEAAKAETNPASSAKLFNEAAEKETALNIKYSEFLKEQENLIAGVERRIAVDAEKAARTEAEKLTAKEDPFALPENLMKRLQGRPKELAQWNMNKAAWDGIKEQRKAIDKLYEAAAKTTNLRESAKLTSEAAEKSAALRKEATEIMQKHVELTGRLNKTLFRQGAEKVVQNPKQLLGWSGAVLGTSIAVSGMASGKGALAPYFRGLFGNEYEENGLGGVIVKTAIGEKNQKAAAEKLSQLGQKTSNVVGETVPRVANEVGRIYNGVANDVSAINSEAGNVYSNVRDMTSNLYHGNQQISDGNGGYYDSTTQQYEGVPQDGSSSQYAMGLARNAMNSVSGGNVSKMDLGTLLGASILGFGRFGLFGKAIGAVMAGSAIHNINKRGQSTQQVQQTQGYSPSQSQPVIQTQEYKTSAYQHPEVSFDDEGNVQHARHM
uniref:hypothetical protein n=1 Tax=Prevotella sp. TaxID=59823 RepID=UPI004025CB1B